MCFGPAWTVHLYFHRKILQWLSPMVAILCSDLHIYRNYTFSNHLRCHDQMLSVFPCYIFHICIQHSIWPLKGFPSWSKRCYICDLAHTLRLFLAASMFLLLTADIPRPSLTMPSLGNLKHSHSFSHYFCEHDSEIPISSVSPLYSSSPVLLFSTFKLDPK